MFGWHGSILRIDLSRKSVEVDTPAPALFHKYIGGRGLAGYLLKDRITRSYDDPDMPILFFTGPLVNTKSPTSGRMTIMSKSPLTGTIGDSSVGGSFGTMLKKAGFDGIIISGCSDHLCGIEISDNKIQFVSAIALAGQTVSKLSRILKDKGATAIIGPAAENGVLYSSIMIDGHYTAGRMGLGLNLASKNIKYITVKGTDKTRVADPVALKNASEDIFRLVSASPALMGEYGISKFGTGALYDLMDARHMMPSFNFKKSRFEPANSLNAPAFHHRFAPESTGCRGCHIRCKKIAADGRPLPEFESMSHFSALIGNSDMETVMAANQFCNDHGMDTISAASTLACYFELTDKHPATENIIALLSDIVFQRGIGEQLGRGSARFAEAFGFPEASMTVKRLELPAYDPRGAYGMALAYSVASRGGCHLRAYPISHEILRKPVPTDRFSFAGKARIIKLQEDVNAVADSLTACKFVFFAATLEEYAKVYSAVTGMAISGQELMKKGERICYQERIMNAQNGFTAKDDDLPARFFDVSKVIDDDTPPKPINREDFLKARASYYVVRGLNENGMPTREKAEELELIKKINIEHRTSNIE
jgi:aldehyde:ferredoxin oxidoreductase